MHSKFDFWQSLYYQNGFPSNLNIQRIRKFLDGHCNYNNDISSKTDGVSNFYFSFPYFGQQSEKFKPELHTIVCKYFPVLRIFILLVNKKKIGSFSSVRG